MTIKKKDEMRKDNSGLLSFIAGGLFGIAIIIVGFIIKIGIIK